MMTVENFAAVTLLIVATQELILQKIHEAVWMKTPWQGILVQLQLMLYFQRDLQMMNMKRFGKNKMRKHTQKSVGKTKNVRKW
jgi:hypothetical protein